MRLQIPSLWLNTGKLLSMICLLLITAGITQAQSTPTLSVNDIAVNETDSGLFGYEFTISLSAPSANLVSVQVCTQDGSATGNVDFVAGCINLDIQPGKTSQTVTVFIKGDTVVEGTEQFFLNLSNPVNATIADGQGVGTIVDDDTLILLNQTSSSRGVVLDSIWHMPESFPVVTNQALYTDNRTRIVVFAIGLKLAAGETASAVTATAEDSVGTVRPLTVEFVGPVPNNNLWLTQVVLKLSDQIITAGDQKIRISLHGQSSNAVLVAVTPQ